MEEAGKHSAKIPSDLNFVIILEVKHLTFFFGGGGGGGGVFWGGEENFFFWVLFWGKVFFVSGIFQGFFF